MYFLLECFCCHLCAQVPVKGRWGSALLHVAEYIVAHGEDPAALLAVQAKSDQDFDEYPY